MPNYPTTGGTMVSKQYIDRKVTQAKKQKVQEMYDENGFTFCERTKRSDSPTDVSHIISVRMCQAEGQSEIAWDLDNLEILTRDEHMKIESWKHHKRAMWYAAKKTGFTFKEFIEDYENSFNQ